MSFHGLHLPRQADPDTLPPVPSSSSSPPPPPMRQPPPSFAQARQHARQLRQDRVKSPFVPRKQSKAAGKDRDLSQLSVQQLADLLDRNARILDSPETFTSLPGGDSRIRNQQHRIQARIQELNDVAQIKHELEETHLDPEGRRRERGGGGGPDGGGVKKEEEEGEMEGVVKTGAADEASSPLAKRRIAAQMLSRSPASLTSSLSLSESLDLQRRAVQRDRDAQLKKEAKRELDAQRPEKTGGLLKGALGVDSALSEFMFQASDSDPEPDDADIDDWLNEGRRAANGQLNAEEDADLNPLRTAYMRGWNQAVSEEKGEGV
ncbi:hypothetical protein JCM8097_008851 [Rhodosporidiobolus ruineniae]